MIGKSLEAPESGENEIPSDIQLGTSPLWHKPVITRIGLNQTLGGAGYDFDWDDDRLSPG